MKRGVLLFGIVVSVLSIAKSASAEANNVDDLIDFLIAEKEAERAALGSEQSSQARHVNAERRSSADVLSKVSSYRVEDIERIDSGGTREVKATFYSQKNGPTYYVRLLQQSPAAAIRQGGVSEIQTLNRIYQKAEPKSQTTVNNYPAAYFDPNAKMAKGLIVKFSEGSFLLIRVSKEINLESLRRFAVELPLEKLVQSLES